MDVVTSKTKIAFANRHVRSFVILYFRNKYALSTLLMLGAILLCVCLGVREISLSYKTSAQWWDALGYSVVVAAGAIAVWRRYKIVAGTLSKAYKVKSGGEIEYGFTNMGFDVTAFPSQIRADWGEVKDLWLSSEVLMLVVRSGKCVPLPILEFPTQQRQFIIGRLSELPLLSERRKRVLRSRFLVK